MSKVAISGAATGTATFTIESPATNTNRTLTLPDNTGTMLTSASSITTSQLPAGSVLQVVSATTTTEVTSSTSAFVDTGLSVSITPTSSSSKILVLVSQNGLGKSSANVDNCLDLRLFRGATSILSPNLAACMSQTSGLNTLNVTAASISYLDSPATTSSTTYKTQFCSRNGAASVTVQFASASTSTITLMEIAG